jgi:hypothetical protein
MFFKCFSEIIMGNNDIYIYYIPSVNPTVCELENYQLLGGKSLCLSSVIQGQFSIAMLNDQRVTRGLFRSSWDAGIVCISTASDLCWHVYLVKPGK